MVIAEFMQYSAKQPPTIRLTWTAFRLLLSMGYNHCLLPLLFLKADSHFTILQSSKAESCYGVLFCLAAAAEVVQF